MDELTKPSVARARVSEFRDARDNARRRRDEEPQLEGAFLAMVGLETDDDVLEFEPGLYLRRLRARPQVWGCELTRTLPVTHQLHAAVPQDEVFNGATLDGVFWTVQSLLRVRRRGYFLATEVANKSWDVIDGFDSAESATSVPVPARRPTWWPHSPLRVEALDCAWISSVWTRTLELRANATFHFALECFTTSFEEPDPRMACIKLWAGVEAVIGVNAELRFRLATLIAALLEPPGAPRVALYRRLKNLYDTRSKVVHGGTVKSEDLLTHVDEVQELSRRLLVRLVGLGTVPDTTALETNLLGGHLA